jgi:protocatechuate 3,4-dioxygenase beta subunit
MPHLDAPHDHDHDLGLAHDLRTLSAGPSRRRTLRWLAAGLGAGGLPLLGCGGGGDAGSTTTATTTTTGSGSGTSATPASVGSCSVIPEETAGPYPADGSNTSNGSIANALATSGIVRADIRSSIGGASGTAAGIPLTVTLRLVNTNASCADLSGYAVYLWHCDRDGNYSMYSAAVLNQNYLRGVQASNASGQVSFTTVFPGCYSGRMPHIHFEVYRSLATATSSTSKIKTSQLALPTDVCSTVYATDGYAASATNLRQISFATDNVFSDGVSLQLASVSGSVSAGYAATLTVGIAA